MTTSSLIALLFALVPQETKPQEPAPQQPAPQEPAAQTQGPGAARQTASGEAAVPAGQQPATSSEAFPNDKLEQIVAPIALYPDALLAQILMASTYPLEIVEAARWSAKNPKVTGDKLEAALKDQTWDPSVKSLCAFPDVLKRMNENLDWVQDLGDAFLAQKEQLMQCVQTMRRKAYDSGNLKTSKELKVTEQTDKVIVIESASPEVVYVPTYYPTAVYGGWSYPYYYYPPMYPPAPAGGMFFSFTAGVVWGAAIWGDCNWGGNDVDIDIDNYNNFIDKTEINGSRKDDLKNRANESGRTGDRAGQTGKGKGSWQHNPEHRKGVGYKDNKTAQQFGGAQGSNRVSRDQARGFSDSGGTRPSTSDRSRGGASSASRPSAGTRDAPSSRPSTSNSSRGSSASNRSSSSSTRGTGDRSGSFSGARSSSMDRASSSRGSASRGSMGSRGGGSRGGGGGRRR